MHSATSPHGTLGGLPGPEGRRQVVLELSVLGTAHRHHQAGWWLHSPSEDCLLKDCCSQYCTKAQIWCDNLDINPMKTDGY